MEEGVGYKACMRCGKLMPDGAAFCNSCGADLGAAASPGLQGAVGPQDFKSAMGLGGTPQAVPPPVPPGEAPPSPGQPPPVPPGPYPAYGPYPLVSGQRRTDDLAVVSLVCALASFLILPILPAVAAIATGFVSRERIRDSGGMLGGSGFALAGILVGALNLLLVLGLVILSLLVYTST
ncbi:MAG: DUF4190 domain-containing protein [Actinomycetota bacterium]